MYALCETHLRAEGVIAVDGFQWFGHNRPDSAISQQAWRGSGGVGFLVSDHMLRRFKATVVDTSTDGIMWLRLTLKGDTDIGMLLCVSYLPPEGSSTGNNAQEFYDSLLSQLYQHYDGSPTVICGDVNARIGTKQDCDGDNSIRARVAMDTISKPYGDHFLNFVNDSNMCIVNGRFAPASDNYTYISTRGKSVVDYFLVPKLQLHYVSDFSVTTVTDATEQYDITLDMNTKIPDHSLVNCNLNLSRYEDFHEYMINGETHGTGNGRYSTHHPVHRRYRVSILPRDLFDNERSRRCLGDIITRLHTAARDQDHIDTAYQELIGHIHTEMDTNLSYKDYTPGTQKRRKRSKPYWDDELAGLWAAARDCEKSYVRCKGRCYNET